MVSTKNNKEQSCLLNCRMDFIGEADGCLPIESVAGKRTGFSKDSG